MRRVVVTGLGAITPLGVGVRRSWSRLLAGQSGIVSTAGYEPHRRWGDLTSTVAGIVPKDGTGDGSWRPGDWLSATDQRRMSLFSQYAIAATEMALEDAGWKPGGDQQDALESTGVCLGSGIGNLDEIYATSLAFERDVSTCCRDHSLRYGGMLRPSFPRATRKSRRYSCRRSSPTWRRATFP